METSLTVTYIVIIPFGHLGNTRSHYERRLDLRYWSFPQYESYLAESLNVQSMQVYHVSHFHPAAITLKVFYLYVCRNSILYFDTTLDKE